MGQRVSCPVLVGREAEVARLRAAIERTVAGQPGLGHPVPPQPDGRDLVPDAQLDGFAQP